MLMVLLGSPSFSFRGRDSRQELSNVAVLCDEHRAYALERFARGASRIMTPTLSLAVQRLLQARESTMYAAPHTNHTLRGYSIDAVVVNLDQSFVKEGSRDSGWARYGSSGR